MWKTSTKETLDRHLSAEAVDACMRYFDLIKTVDELAAGRQNIPDVVAATADFISGYRGNKFYANHRALLKPIADYGYLFWAEALVASRTANTDNARTVMAMTRRQFHEFAMACASIEGKNGMDLRSELILSQVL